MFYSVFTFFLSCSSFLSLSYIVFLVVPCCFSPCSTSCFVFFLCLAHGSRKQSLHMVGEFVAPTASRNHGGDATAEQGRRQQQQLMEAVRQKQMQMHQQARQPQGAPPTATAGMEKQFQHQQLNTRGSITSTHCDVVKTSGKTERGKSRRPWQG